MSHPAPCCYPSKEGKIILKYTTLQIRESDDLCGYFSFGYYMRYELFVQKAGGQDTMHNICQSASSTQEVCVSRGAHRQPAVKLRHVRQRLTGPPLWSDSYGHQPAEWCHPVGAERVTGTEQSGEGRCLRKHSNISPCLKWFIVHLCEITKCDSGWFQTSGCVGLLVLYQRLVPCVQRDGRYSKSKTNSYFFLFCLSQFMSADWHP